MRLFRGHHGGGGGFLTNLGRGLGRHRGHGGGDDESLGSSISTKDQFDIVVQVKMEKKESLATSFSFSADDTTVSSITTEEVYYTPSRKIIMKEDTASVSSSSWCCCSTAATEATADATDITHSLLSSHKSSEKQEASNQQTQSSVWGCCTAISDIPVVPQTKRPNKSDLAVPRSNSLFDSLCEEEFDLVENKQTTHGIKRIRKSLRSVLSWNNRRLTKREMEYMRSHQQ